jgi:prolyl oligopeptidase
MRMDRRWLLKSAGAAALTTVMPRIVSADPKSGPPIARVEPVTDVYFGVKVVDPYRWMENPKDPDWLPFLRGQNEYTRSVLDKLHGRAALLKHIEALTGDVVLTSRVQPAGDLLFFEQRPAGAENFKLYVRGPDRKDRLLVDPTQMKLGEAHVSLDWWEPSPDGTHVVYGLSPAGSEASVMHIMVVATGEILPERVEKTDSATPNWLPDSSGFFYLQFTGKRGTPEFYLDGHARFHRLRTDPGSDPIVLNRDLYPDVPLKTEQSPLIFTARGSKTVVAAVVDVRPEMALWSASLEEVLQGRPHWLPICTFDDEVTSFTVLGGDLYLLANKGFPRGRVLKTSIVMPDLAHAVEVMPQGNAVIESLAGAGDGVFVTLMDGGVQRLSRIGRDGVVGAIPLPFEGAVEGVYTVPDRDGAYLNLTSWLVPRGIWHVAGGGLPVDAGFTPRPAIDVSSYQVQRAFATAKDGVRIPYWMISRKGMVRNGHIPTLVTGYGAYQISNTPAFTPKLLALLDAGAVYVVANVRGGGEYGREWHAAGQKETKPNTWRDLIAVCEQLITDKVTRPAQLAIWGGSAGGITVGRALTERPELFAAVISNVGWSNPLRYVAEQDSYGEIEEWGSIDDEKGFRGLLAMDSYQSVKDGVRYPAVLCITGITDPRVAPFHVAKFAARLQAASVSGNPVLLRVDFDAGHGIGSTRSQADALTADMYSFVLWRTGVKSFQPG